MVIINETLAWEIIEKYSNECAQLDPESLVAVYVIGSLSDGYYRPGESDIDAVLLVSDGSGNIWGNYDKPSSQLSDLNKKYKEKYSIPKDFGPFPLQLKELYPPYEHDNELTLEIARLKLQGKAVYGDYPVGQIPMPTREDFLLDFKHFEEWWDNEFSREFPIEGFSVRACINTILMHMNRYLIIEKDIIQFNKLKIIPLYTSFNAPFQDKSAIDVVERCLFRSDNITEEETKNIREFVSYLRSSMNTLLGLRN
jgi:predicted nucleotidyltransferase